MKTTNATNTTRYVTPTYDSIDRVSIRQIGTLLRETIVPRAIRIIQDECHDLTITKKVGYDGVKDDLATNGDKRAQAMYMQELNRYFPTFGIIAEEDGVAIEGTSTEGDDIYFTIDPLDGTKAYERGSSQGVGTMIALVKNNDVVSAYIGDANTGEVYGFAGLEEKGEVTRQRFGITTNLAPDIARPLTKQYVLLRNMPSKQPRVINRMTAEVEDGGLFKDAEVGGGSIGMLFARLWKGEIGAIALNPNHDTPWDMAPIIGICRRLGFKFFKVIEDEVGSTLGTLVPYDPALTKTVYYKPHSELIIHESHEQELRDWLSRQR